MKTIFIPRNIKVGYQERKYTYSGKLAYVIYTDHENKLRKESSWQSWRDDKIDSDSFTNEPMDGFVLNKHAGGYSSGWNHRQSYIRVYDPRGFEFEITLDNLLYILENVNSIKGKGLDGKFVYAWDKTDLVLIPVAAPDYKEAKEYSDMLFDSDTLKGNDLILGAKYNTKQGKVVTYLGRFDYFPEGVRRKKTIKKYFFRTDNNNRWSMYENVSSLKNKIISLADETCAENYAEMISDLQRESIYSPEDKSKFKYTQISYEKFFNSGQMSYLYLLHDEDYIPIKISVYYFELNMFKNEERYEEFSSLIKLISNRNQSSNGYRKSVNTRSIFPCYKIFSAEKYLENGKKLRGRYEK
jgi:hypothetical protein